MTIYLKRIGLEIYNNKYTKFWFILWFFNSINLLFFSREVDVWGLSSFNIVWCIASLISLSSLLYIEIRILYEVTNLGDESIDIEFSLFLRRLIFIYLLYFFTAGVIVVAGYAMASSYLTSEKLMKVVAGRSIEQEIFYSFLQISLDLPVIGFISSRNTDKWFHKILFIFETKKLRETFLLYAGCIFLSNFLVEPIGVNFLNVNWLFSLSFKLIAFLLFVTIIRQWQDAKYRIAKPSA